MKKFVILFKKKPNPSNEKVFPARLKQPITHYTQKFYMRKEKVSYNF